MRLDRGIRVWFLWVGVVAAGWLTARADEGMWLFNALPVQELAERHGFRPTEAWARHVMLSSVRFNSGGSASFVSSTGLVLTNHHVAADTLFKISTAEHNYLRDGFLARTLAEERKAPDLELNQLLSIDDVTDRVLAAVTPDMSTADAFQARRAVMARIEKESLDTTGLRSDVITLFGGATYHLYRYKKYTDVRVVWAPESAVASFGGDADNFEYPRYCLDVSLLRVYEDGKPARVENFLKVAPSGLTDGALVFVSGNPGRTQRSFTVSALKYLRDYQMPYMLDLLRRREILLQQFGIDSTERERRARDDLHSVQNSRKAYLGMLQGLQDPAFLAAKERQETDLLARLRGDAELRHFADAWDQIAAVQRQRAELQGMTASFRAQYYDIAENLLLMAAEDQKPSPERLREYRDSARESLAQQLFSPAPIYDDLELEILADSLALLVERRGGDDPLVVEVLAGKSPRQRAAELVGGTRLADVAARQQIARGGQQAIDASTDPMIQLARLMEGEYRRLRKIRDELDEIERQAYAQITLAKAAAQAATAYPDATFTLRLAFGVVKGYAEDGQPVPPWTTVGGAFARQAAHDARPPWALPPSWTGNKEALDLETPMNFVCTADIIGGNSGSPVINGDAELVGVIFDGNIQSLTADYVYTDEVARAVAVHAGVILEALRKVYGAGDLADAMGR